MGNLVFQERRGWIIKDGACSANDHLTMAGTQTIGGSRTPRPVIQVFGIRKTYGSTLAVSDVSFEVNEGEIFGLIGPNGAGKTTTMECVEGVRRPDRGTISILGWIRSATCISCRTGLVCSSNRRSYRRESRFGRRWIYGRRCIRRRCMAIDYWNNSGWQTSGTPGS
jgi:ABC-type molybdenum transport system ATPase subunit/photorepair protein PhrA